MNLRIGKLTYLNNLPIYYHFLNHHSYLAHKHRIIEGTPCFLNQGIRKGEIDLSVVSSIEYARNFDDYLIFPDLSISSQGPVESVLLFSRVTLEELHQRPLLISSDSETSVALIKIIFSQYGVEPLYMRGRVPESEQESFGFNNEFAAMLVIGDMALQLRRQCPYPYVYDLGEEWQKITGLPFVFALWIVRQEAFIRDPELVFEVYHALIESRNYSLGHLEEVIAYARKPASLSPSDCLHYFKNLRFELSSSYQKGLKMYFDFLFKQGEIPCPVRILKLLSLP